MTKVLRPTHRVRDILIEDAKDAIREALAIAYPQYLFKTRSRYKDDDGYDVYWVVYHCVEMSYGIRSFVLDWDEQKRIGNDEASLSVSYGSSDPIYYGMASDPEVIDKLVVACLTYFGNIERRNPSSRLGAFYSRVAFIARMVVLKLFRRY